jgi:hypothetical protein
MTIDPDEAVIQAACARREEVKALRMSLSFDRAAALILWAFEHERASAERLLAHLGSEWVYLTLLREAADGVAVAGEALARLPPARVRRALVVVGRHFAATQLDPRQRDAVVAHCRAMSPSWFEALALALAPSS